MKLRLPFSRRDYSSGLDNPSVDLISALISELEGGPTPEGVRLPPNRAMRLTAVNACVRVLAEGVGGLPCPIYRKEGRSRISMPGDIRWRLLNDEPNPEMYAMELHETTIAHANLWGKGFIYVVRNKAGMPAELWPLRPDRTEPKRGVDGRLYYQTQLADGEWVPLAAEEVIEVKALLGLSPIRTARPAISGAAAAEDFGGHFWANSARPGGVIEVDHRMDEEEYTEFRRRWNSGHQGLARSQLVGILTGATWKDVGIAPQLAQYIETRKFGVREIARLFRVPPHMIGDLEGTVTRASIETQSIEFVIHCLRPWLVRYEQALKRNLFNLKSDRTAGLYPEFNADALLRGDLASRYDSFAKGIQFGWLSRSDVRELDNWPEIAGLDKFLVPVNMMSSDAVTDTPPDATTAATVAALSLMMRSNGNASEVLAELATQIAGKNGNGDKD